MSKYQAYSEYKDSGIEWVGETPIHWHVKPLFSVAATESVKNTAGQETNVLSLSYGNIIPRDVETNFGLLPASFNTYQFVNPGDLVLRLTDLQNDKRSLRVGHAKQSGIITSAYLKLIAKSHELNDRYLYRLLHSYDTTKVFYGMGGGLRQSMTFEEMRRLAVLVPTLQEQKIIANFLDHETAKIDTLIDKQQQLIQLLKEKRQAVISHAVTKGLNPNAPMRDSGVEWLGEVPEHWQVRRLKHTSKLQSGIPKGKDLTGKLSISVPMLRVANVQDGFLDLEDVHMMKIEPEQLTRFSLQKGDVLMNEGGDNDKLGRGAVWQGEIEPCIHQNHVFAIRPYSIEPEWLDLITRASYAKFHFYRVAKQSTNLASISSTNIKETPLTVPPELERKEILTYVQGKLNSFESIEKKCVTQIKLLQERRTALISAAVTGKIDVRHHALRPAGNDTIG